MFYYMILPSLTYHWLLIAAAVIPAVFLMIKVYRSDRLEKESPGFLFRLALAGVIATLLAMLAERIGGYILDFAVPKDSKWYNIILYFVIVGFAEEGAKFKLLKRNTWYSDSFNCQYDAVIYSVFVSLGFALWENISYVLHYGFSTALVRAVTAIPGHACFSVFMGAFYGVARGCAYLNENGKAKVFRILSVVIPALIHGCYDYFATVETAYGELAFFGFIAVLFAVSYVLVSRLSKNDRYYSIDRREYVFIDPRS